MLARHEYEQVCFTQQNICPHQTFSFYATRIIYFGNGSKIYFVDKIGLNINDQDERSNYLQLVST